MAKMYKKSDLKFENGYVLTQDDEVVALPHGIAEQLNEMETLLQQQQYLLMQPAAKPEPSLDGFKRESIVKVPRVKVSTKHLDKQIKRSENILEDLRQLSLADKVNGIIDKYRDLMVFLDGDSFVEGTDVVMIDTPVIGDPLGVDSEIIIRTLCSGAGID